MAGTGDAPAERPAPSPVEAAYRSLRAMLLDSTRNFSASHSVERGFGELNIEGSLGVVVSQIGASKGTGA